MCENPGSRANLSVTGPSGQAGIEDDEMEAWCEGYACGDADGIEEAILHLETELAKIEKSCEADAFVSGYACAIKVLKEMQK